MRLVAVGTGTVVPERNRGCTCFYLESAGSRLLLDCGSGAVQGLARCSLAWQSLTDLVVTHFHTDHVGAIPGLLFALKHGMRPRRREPLDVWGPRGTRRLFAALAEAFGEFILDPGFPLRIHELSVDAPGRTAGGLEVAVHGTPHTEESQAVRIRGQGATVAYTGDTGLPEGTAEALGAFLRGVDVLVAECSLTDEEVGDNHLSPARLADLALEARPGLLWITHVYPHVRARHDVGELVRSAGYEGTLRVVEDGDEWGRSDRSLIPA